jgi:hypothetical protein
MEWLVLADEGLVEAENGLDPVPSMGPFNFSHHGLE